MSQDQVQRFIALAPKLEGVKFDWQILVAGFLMLLVGSLCAVSTNDFPEGVKLHHQMASPVLALQLPHSKADLETVLSPRRVEDELSFEETERRKNQVKAIFAQHLFWDKLFIPCYSLFFFLLGTLLRKKLLSRSLLNLALIIMLLADYGENWRMAVALDMPFDSLSDGIAHSIKTFSLIKWGAFTVVMFWFARAMSKVVLDPLDRTLTGILTIFLFIGGIFGLTGLLSPDDVPERLRGLLFGMMLYNHLTMMTIIASLLPLLACVEAVRRVWKFLSKLWQPGASQRTSTT